ncbi:6-phosphogluconolactonase, partial [Saccharopolyspora gregorii]|uniref:6-phosphogluconolactonase n=1 Tax=Saccharopolyspora gregorii TaxID=33914 RepID=UPI0031F118E5
LITRIVDAQAARGSASVVLTGGRTARRARTGPALPRPGRGRLGERGRVWGDERFLPDGDPERNETQARAALLDHVAVDPERCTRWPRPTASSARTPTRPPRTTRSCWRRWPSRP